MKTIFLVRHGTTDWVDSQILHGITDVPLNEKGKSQANQAAKSLHKLNIKTIYSSSLSRCIETAQIIGGGFGIEPILKNDLVEVDFGWLEGKNIRDHDSREYGKLVKFFDHYLFLLVGKFSGESRKRFTKRVLGVWQSILNSFEGGSILIVGHSGVFNTILMSCFGEKYLNGQKFHHINPCSITEINFNSTNIPHLVRLNDCNHLSKETL